MVVGERAPWTASLARPISKRSISRRCAAPTNSRTARTEWRVRAATLLFPFPSRTCHANRAVPREQRADTTRTDPECGTCPGSRRALHTPPNDPRRAPDCPSCDQTRRGLQQATPASDMQNPTGVDANPLQTQAEAPMPKLSSLLSVDAAQTFTSGVARAGISRTNSNAVDPQDKTPVDDACSRREHHCDPERRRRDVPACASHRRITRAAGRSGCPLPELQSSGRASSRAARCADSRWTNGRARPS